MNKKTGITLITMGQGNIIALGETLKSFSGVVDEIIYGDLLLYPQDRKALHEYKKQYNINIRPLPFNYIFQMGFASCLNFLASHATNDMVMYMNTSEAIDEDYGIVETVQANPECNMFYFTHRQERHRWFRCYNRKQLEWSGVIHEEVVPIKGECIPYHKPIFMMKDLEKDMHDPLKAAVFNSVKELCYFNNYMKLVDAPKVCGATNIGWFKFAQDQYPSMNERLEQKGKQYEAFLTGNFDMFLNEIETSDYFKTERFESKHGMNFQGTRKDLV
jgi:hypothetical protein